MATQQAPARQTFMPPSGQHQPQELTGVSGDGTGETLAKALGWFSIGLGAAEIFAPNALSRAIGIQPHPLLMPTYGLREIAAGIGLLRTKKPAEWAAARIVGDVVDIASLAAALPSSRANHGRVMFALANVLGVTALDIYAFQRLSYRRNPAREPVAKGVRVQRTMTLNCTRDEAFAFWRNFANLPRFMFYLDSVEVQEGGRRSHWVAKGPGGAQVSWDAEMTEEQPGELIAWQSLPGSMVETAGRVEFRDAPANRGTEVCVQMIYNPPGGQWGDTVARLFGRSGEQEIREDLRRFKQLMETGEVATTHGQPKGTCH
jgi:uncharacterized membrane protein